MADFKPDENRTSINNRCCCFFFVLFFYGLVILGLTKLRELPFSISVWDGIFLGIGSVTIVGGAAVFFTGGVVKFLLGVKGCGQSFFKWPKLSSCWVTSFTLLSEQESKSSRYVSSALGNTLFRYLVINRSFCLMKSFFRSGGCGTDALETIMIIF